MCAKLPRELKRITERFYDNLKTFPLDSLQKGLPQKLERSFIGQFGTILSLNNVLRPFDEFAGNEILQPLEMQDYQSLYLDLYDKIKSIEM